MDKLGLVHKKQKMIFANLGTFYLVPLHGHAFAGVKFHYNLLAVYLVRKTLEQHLALLQLSDPIKLYPPKQ